MIVIFGTRDYGPAHGWKGTRVVTRFFHVSFVPLLPLESYLVYPDHDGDQAALAIRPSVRSILSGLVLGWGVAPCAVLGFVAVGSLFERDGVTAVATFAGLVASVGAIMAARRVLARESLEGRRLRVLGLDVIGLPIDPRWLLPGDAQRERARWGAWLDRRRTGLGETYRTTPDDPFAAALVADAEASSFVKVAAVVALLDEALGARRGAWRPLVARLVAIDPRVDARANDPEEGLLDAEPVPPEHVAPAPARPPVASTAAQPPSPEAMPVGVVSRMPEALAEREASRAAWTGRAAGLAALVVGVLVRVFSSEVVGGVTERSLLPGTQLEQHLVEFGAEWLAAFGAVFVIVGVPRQRLRWRTTPESVYVAAVIGAAFVAVASACWRLVS